MFLSLPFLRHFSLTNLPRQIYLYTPHVIYHKRRISFHVTIDFFNGWFKNKFQIRWESVIYVSYSQHQRRKIFFYIFSFLKEIFRFTRSSNDVYINLHFNRMQRKMIFSPLCFLHHVVLLIFFSFFWIFFLSGLVSTRIFLAEYEPWMNLAPKFNDNHHKN